MTGCSRRGARCAVSLLTAALMAGCGVPMQASADRLPSQDLPTVSAPSPPTSTPLPGDTSSVAEVYLLQRGRLVEVPRPVSNPDLPGPVLDALLAGPTRAEAADSIGTAIPAGTPPLDVTVVDRGIALVVVPPRFETLEVAEQILVVAQLVYTVTGIGGITGLQMTHGTEIIDVPTGDGRLTPGPVFRAAYSSLAPGSFAAPTTSPPLVRPGGP